MKTNFFPMPAEEKLAGEQRFFVTRGSKISYTWNERPARLTPALSDEWRSWIAENLILGATAEDVAAQLRQHLQIPVAAGMREIGIALNSPYLKGARRLRNRLEKRDWLLNIPSQLSKLSPIDIPRRARLTTEDFLRDHYATNRPVIITGMLDDCSALTKWTLDWLESQFGDRTVEVQLGRNADENYELNSIAHKREMSFGEYVRMIRTCKKTNDFYMTANNDSRNREALSELWLDVPRLPEYLSPSRVGEGFFWFGPAGTVTPFHHDLTNNFMMQIAGRKRIRLIAPWDTPKLQNHRHCFTPVDGRHIDFNRFPVMQDVAVIDCVLAPGEILFLPVGWWHFVEAMEISITVAATNFRWDNEFVKNYPEAHDF